jgi:hypothetical protein
MELEVGKRYTCTLFDVEEVFTYREDNVMEFDNYGHKRHTCSGRTKDGYGYYYLGYGVGEHIKPLYEEPVNLEELM